MNMNNVDKRVVFMCAKLSRIKFTNSGKRNEFYDVGTYFVLKQLIESYVESPACVNLSLYDYIENYYMLVK